VRLAFYTFGILREPRGHPQVQGFYERSDGAVESAEGTDGFIVLRRDRPVDFGPRFFDPAVDAGAPQTLSVWTNLESAFAFAYHGRHAEALRGRKQWFSCPAHNGASYAEVLGICEGSIRDRHRPRHQGSPVLQKP
jgi:hypothetical protein